MSAIGLVGLGSSIGGFFSDDVKEFGRQYFGGSFEVTAGSVISGIYGQQYEAVFGPNVTHSVNQFLGGLYGINTGDRPLEALLSLLLGIGGNVGFTSGLQVNAVYGGPQYDIIRGPTLTKKGMVPTLGEMWGGALAGQPQGIEADELAAHDMKTLRMVTILTQLLNLTVGITQMVMHMKYPDYHRPRAKSQQEKDDKGQPVPDESDRLAWYEAPRILDAVVTQLPRRIMGVIVLLERTGGSAGAATALRQSATHIANKARTLAGYVVAAFTTLNQWRIALGLAIGQLFRAIGTAIYNFFADALRGLRNVLTFIRENIALTLFITAGAAALAGVISKVVQASRQR